MTDETAYRKGVDGEAFACGYLMKKGMVLLQRRYHSPFGEIDLVMRDQDALVFVEVKRRDSGRAYDGALAVTPLKQARLIKTARCYLAQHPAEGVIRFDVVEITGDGLLHIPNAFQGSEW